MGSKSSKQKSKAFKAAKRNVLRRKGKTERKSKKLLEPKEVETLLKDLNQNESDTQKLF